ncbi:hypothetical protein ANCDUO_10864 [Ancylostoma duodenale]|uniref:Uncharacterized protein n=1 Tax=Ancylostoma duodenale TaxID=51022 RepID=A0A0C2GPQ1_9BILA|nr:hypothetical protein ANCDUO_10864 [Ancylostoma duodenale]
MEMANTTPTETKTDSTINRLRSFKTMALLSLRIIEGDPAAEDPLVMAEAISGESQTISEEDVVSEVHEAVHLIVDGVGSTVEVDSREAISKEGEDEATGIETNTDASLL